MRARSRARLALPHRPHSGHRGAERAAGPRSGPPGARRSTTTIPRTPRRRRTRSSASPWTPQRARAPGGTAESASGRSGSSSSGSPRSCSGSTRCPGPSRSRGAPRRSIGHLAKQSAELLKAEKGLVFLFDRERRQMVAQAPGLRPQPGAGRRRPATPWTARPARAGTSGRTGPSCRTRRRRTRACSPTRRASSRLQSCIIAPIDAGPGDPGHADGRGPRRRARPSPTRT